MNKYLFTILPTNDLGLLTRSLPIAHELRNRGHEIVFCNPGKAPIKLIRESGFENLLPQEAPYFYITGDIISFSSFYRLIRSNHLKRDLEIFLDFSRNFFESSTAEIWNMDHFMYLFGMGNEDFVRINVDALMKLISDYEVDAVVDFWNPFACIAARASHKPLITVIQADMHPHSRGFIWWKDPPSDLPTPVSTVNKILAEHKLQSVGTIGGLLVGDMTLVVGLPETDPLPETADVTYIGPILWQRIDSELPDWITNLNTEQPVIWVYPGNPRYITGRSSPFDSGVILHACIEALKDEPVQVVLTMGHHSLPKRVRSLPPNFRHEPYVPGLAMAERSNLLIHHGGYGSCQTGLYTGTPAVIIPTFSERESNARRIADLGAGDFVLPTTDISGRNKQIPVEDLRAKVKNVLSDSSFTENAKRISQMMQSTGGAFEAARQIECFAQG